MQLLKENDMEIEKTLNKYNTETLYKYNRHAAAFKMWCITDVSRILSGIFPKKSIEQLEELKKMAAASLHTVWSNHPLLR
jgi:hypothetical protein